MSYQSIRFHIRGVSGHIQHNSRLANPLDPLVRRIKQITGKRKKTEEDIINIANLEWQGGLYLNSNEQVIVPGELIEAMLLTAAKSQRRGQDFRAAVVCDEDPILIYPNPRKVEQLLEDPKHRIVRMMTVKQSKVLRTRPYFPVWELEFTVKYHDGKLNKQDVIDAMRYAAEFVGLSSSRPRYGRFEVLKPAA